MVGDVRGILNPDTGVYIENSRRMRNSGYGWDERTDNTAEYFTGHHANNDIGGDP